MTIPDKDKKDKHVKLETDQGSPVFQATTQKANDPPKSDTHSSPKVGRGIMTPDEMAEITR
ncbi:MAG: hypothetical protein AAB534_00535 [Patescibacteria group bacterium]